jgi:hypothetical protein
MYFLSKSHQLPDLSSNMLTDSIFARRLNRSGPGFSPVLSEAGDAGPRKMLQFKAARNFDGHQSTENLPKFGTGAADEFHLDNLLTPDVQNSPAGRQPRRT